MSQYAEFFIRKGKNDYTFLDSFSRNSEIQLVLDEARFLKWEKIVHLNDKDFRYLSEIIQGKIKFIDDEIKKEKEQIELITKMNNNINDKLKSIGEYMTTIEEMENEKESYQYAMNFFDIFGSMAENFPYSAKNQEIYGGLEVGTNPTDNDIA